MAKEIDGSVLGNFSGQIGDKVISRKGKKKYIKEKGKKINHHRKPKMKTEGRFRDLSNIWKSITMTERRTWYKLLKGVKEFKNKENQVIKDTKNLFVSLNRNLQEIGEPVRTKAPNGENPQMMFNAKVEMLIKKKKLSINVHLSNPIEEDTKVIVYATESLTNPSESVNPRYYRIITVLDSGFESGSSILGSYLKVFGKTGGVGEEYSFKFTPVNKNSGVKGYPATSRTAIIKVN